jgi:hypothetical protein
MVSEPPWLPLAKAIEQKSSQRWDIRHPDSTINFWIMPIAWDYSGASQSFLFAPLTRAEHDFIPPDAGVRQV